MELFAVFCIAETLGIGCPSQTIALPVITVAAYSEIDAKWFYLDWLLEMGYYDFKIVTVYVFLPSGMTH